MDRIFTYHNTRGVRRMRGLKEGLGLLNEFKQSCGVYFAVETGYTKQTESLAIQVKPVQVKEDNRIGIEVMITALNAPVPVENGDADLCLACIKKCIEETKSDNYYQRLLACVQLAYLGDPSAVSILQELRTDSNFYVNAAAEKALRDIKLPRFRIEELAGISLALCDKWWGKLAESCISEDGKAFFTIGKTNPPHAHCYLKVAI